MILPCHDGDGAIHHGEQLVIPDIEKTDTVAGLQAVPKSLIQTFQHLGFRALGFNGCYA